MAFLLPAAAEPEQGGKRAASVCKAQATVIKHLAGLGLQISPEKVQPPAPKVKFLGIW